MKWLCKIRLHSWTLKGFTNLLLSDSLEVCRRCGAGRAWFSYGQACAFYTPEQMKQHFEAQRCATSEDSTS